MLPPQPSRIVFLIFLPIITGLGLFVFVYLYPFVWQPDLHPMWGWVICGMGLCLAILSTVGFLWPPLEDDWIILGFLCAGGVLILVAGWTLESTILLLSYLLRGLLYLASFMLVGFGAWQAISMPSDHAVFQQQHSQGHAAGYAEGHAKGYTEGYAESYKKGYAAGVTDGLAKQYTSSTTSRGFDPYEVLVVPRDATQGTIRKAYRDQVQLYHPDKVSHLGNDLQQMAARKTQDINRAYEMLRRR